MHEQWHVGTPPQSEAEIAPIRERMQLLDPLLDLRWNAHAFVAKYASFDAQGRPSQPKYEGRWEVIRFNTDRLHLERDFAVVCTVCQIRQEGRVPVMEDKGPYAPVGMWLVDYLQLWDRAQGRLAADAMRELWDEHEQAGTITHDRNANQEACEKVYARQSKYWMGGAQGKADPETAAALWPATTP